MNVSIVTITQYKRFDLLKLLYKNILNQTYENIIEWLIIEGSDNISDAEQNEKLINELKKNSIITINYVPFIKKNNYGKLLNNGLKNVLGDVIVHMDDDDYYFPSRVQHCVEKFKNNNYINIVNCCNIYVHDIILDYTIKLNMKDCININSLAYTKNYIKNNMFEEIDGNNNILKQMNEAGVNMLNSDDTVVKIIHNENSFISNKRYIVMNEIIINNTQSLENMIPKEFYEEYKKNFVDETELEYDIIYFTGGTGIIWDPNDKSLGGSEQAIVHLSENMKKQGKSVIVYGNFNNDYKLNDIEYIKWDKFPFKKKMKNVIVWRHHGISMLMNLKMNIENIYIDFHDNFSYTLAYLDQTILINFLKSVNKYFFKSNYHKICFEEFFNTKLENSNYMIIPNGVRKDSFSNNENYIRNPYRFCYCSCYSRGLEIILEKIWPIIYNSNPKCELHVYYGMKYFDDEFKNKMKLLLSQPGVMDHDRQPMDMIIREKYLSTFHLYLNESIAEIDCISIRESLITGCIPIISNFGVFKERHGIQYKWEQNNDELHKKIANDIITKMNNTELINNIRNKIINSNTIIPWDNISKQWLNSII